MVEFKSAPKISYKIGKIWCFGRNLQGVYDVFLNRGEILTLESFSARWTVFSSEIVSILSNSTFSHILREVFTNCYIRNVAQNFLYKML